MATRTGGMGMLRVSPARCLRPRSSRLAPSLVQPVPAQGVEGGQVDPAPPGGGQDAVGFAEGDGFGGAQGGVVQAAEERFHVLPARALPADGREEQRSLGGVGDGAAVDGLGDVGSFPLDLPRGLAVSSRRSTAYPSALANTARLRRVVVAAAGLPSSRRARSGRRGRCPVLPARPPAATLSRSGQRAGNVRRGRLAGGGVECVAEQGPAEDGGVGEREAGPGQGQGDGGEGLSGRAAGFGGQVRPISSGCRRGRAHTRSRRRRGRSCAGREARWPSRTGCRRGRRS